MITDYSSLKSAVADWLNRTDLTDVIPTFIANAEATFKRDRRLRKLQNRGSFSISVDGVTLPTDLMELESWYYDGGVYYGEIDIVTPGQIGELKASVGPTGAPAYAALIDGKAYFAPAPDQTYSTKMTYWRTIQSLSDSVTTNWLIEDHQDIYLYGALLEAAPYLKDDTRIQIWAATLEKRIQELHKATDNEQYSGSLKRPITPIGG